MSNRRKRIILCLDGTWVNSDKGYNPPTLQQPNASLQVPSNVTRLYRALRKRDSDGLAQVMYYHPGVGTTGNLTDMIAGGIFGAGISEVGLSDIFDGGGRCLTTDDRILGKLMISSQQIMSLAMKLFSWASLVVHSLHVAWR